MENKNFIQSKIFKAIIIILSGLIAAIFIFRIGVFVGYRKAGFSFNSGENYYRLFVNRKNTLPGGFPGMMGGGMGMMGDNLMNSYGATGKIIKIALPDIIVADRDGSEKNITIIGDTVIRKFRESLKPEDLQVGDYVIVIGSPRFGEAGSPRFDDRVEAGSPRFDGQTENDSPGNGIIEAHLIRILPESPLTLDPRISPIQ